MPRLLGRRDSGGGHLQSGSGATNAAGEPLLLDQEERVPWLAVDEDEPESAFDTRRVLTAAVIGVLLVMAMIAGFWLWSERTNSALVADGSTIEAPDEPYKVRPDDPGGLEVAGTGNTSFAVAEGLEREGRIVAAPPPAPEPDETGDDEEGDAAGDALEGGIGVQIGAYPSREEASESWVRLRDRTEALQGRRHVILEGSADSGTIYRLQAVAGSEAEAEVLCEAIRAEGGDCQVKD